MTVLLSRCVGLCLTLTLLWGYVSDSVAAAIPDVRIGVLAYRDQDATHATWQSTIDHLNQSLPAYHFVLRQGDHQSLQRAIENGDVDFILTNPGHYVTLETLLGASRIATLEQYGRPAAENTLGTTVIARADRSDLNTLKDLKGQRMAATSAEGFTSYQVIWRELEALGLKPETDFPLLFTGLPMDKVWQAIESGKADVGAIRGCLLETLPHWEQRFKVLSPEHNGALGCTVSSRLYPDWPLASLRYTNPALAREVAVALLQMPTDAHGVSWAVPADYQSVHELFKELKIGPYQYLREPTLQHLAKRYWPILAFALLVLVGWLIYTVRVEYLIQKRTLLLQNALKEGEAMRERMQASQEQADHLSRLSILGELSANLAHELNQPLAGIINYGQSLLRRQANGILDDKALNQAASEIVTQAETAAGILGRVRSFARKRPPVREHRPITRLIQDSLDLFSNMLSTPPPIVFDARLPPDTCIQADPLQIQQVLLNLLKNGLDAMQDLPAEQRLLHVGVTLQDRMVAIAVRDWGHGLQNDTIPHVFDAFYTTKENGLGLGLAICVGIAEAHGGQLTATKPDNGSGMIFTLLLPAHD